MKVVIVGGVAGGASVATRLRRMDEYAEIVLLERGSYISFANCGLPYYIGGVIPERDKLLVQTPEALRAAFDVEARIDSEVVQIDRENPLAHLRERAAPVGVGLAPCGVELVVGGRGRAEVAVDDGVGAEEV